MNPFDMPFIITYCRSRVVMDLSHIVFDIFDFENTVTLKSGSGVTQGHRNWHHSTDWLWFPIGGL